MGDTQECRDCGTSFPYNEDADRCASCVVEMDTRTFLVHLNVSVPSGDTRTEQEIKEAIEGALSVGWDDDSVRELEVCVVLTEQV